MRFAMFSLCAALVAAGLTVPAQAQTPQGEVTLQVVKYAQLQETVKSYRGKIVVVDVWATYCVPCRKEFPHLVELHRKHAKDGVVCISVTVDEPDKQEKALKFLKSQGATFPNFLLNEDAEVWQEKWKSKTVPIVFVIGPDGHQVAKFSEDDPDKQFTYADVIKVVEGLLQRR
jgi:thiol-disulfide isomerase/thioredoxin